jgi:hypothetical protein
VMTLVLAFFRPRLWFTAILVELASLLSYLPFLFNKTQHGPMVPLQLLATMDFVALVAIVYALVGDLRVDHQLEAADRPAPASPVEISRPAESRELLPAHPA